MDEPTNINPTPGNSSTSFPIRRLEATSPTRSTCAAELALTYEDRSTIDRPELRVQRAGKPIRIFYAWDPRRVCLSLIGGDKTGDDQFYERMVAMADDLYDEHLETLLPEGERDKGGGKGG